MLPSNGLTCGCFEIRQRSSFRSPIPRNYRGSRVVRSNNASYRLSCKVDYAPTKTEPFVQLFANDSLELDTWCTGCSVIFTREEDTAIRNDPSDRKPLCRSNATISFSTVLNEPVHCISIELFKVSDLAIVVEYNLARMLCSRRGNEEEKKEKEILEVR